MKNVEFHYQTDFKLNDEAAFKNWLLAIVEAEAHSIHNISYVFCSDDYLHQINLEFLKHDTYTDIITFDYSENKRLNLEVYISIDRVTENAQNNNFSFENELLRVMAHALLHAFGYKDKTAAEKKIMRTKEEEKINMFHVEL